MNDLNDSICATLYGKPHGLTLALQSTVWTAMHHAAKTWRFMGFERASMP